MPPPTKRPKKRKLRGGTAVRGRTVFAPSPAPPEPGFWKVMQRFRAAVIQWAWTCPKCRTTEYVLNHSATTMEAGDRRERCPNGCVGEWGERTFVVKGS